MLGQAFDHLVEAMKQVADIARNGLGKPDAIIALGQAVTDRPQASEDIRQLACRPAQHEDRQQGHDGHGEDGGRTDHGHELIELGLPLIEDLREPVAQGQEIEVHDPRQILETPYLDLKGPPPILVT